MCCRKALLERCVRDDWQGKGADASCAKWLKAGVRPGRLLNTIAALQVGLAQEGLQPDNKEVMRLHEIKADVFSTLEEMAHSNERD